MNLAKETEILKKMIITYNNPQKLDNKKEKVYQELIDCITRHNHKYYIENNPIISDKEYDNFFDYLKKIEECFPNIISSNSPTQKLVGQIQEGFTKANHIKPMLSLENSYNNEDIQKRHEKNIKEIKKNNLGGENIDLTYILEPKFDGVGIDLIYKNGILYKAITRGDGTIGDDITNNIKSINNIIKKIDNKKIDNKKIDELHIRGEILMPKKVLQEINIDRKNNGLNLFSNTRNAASGSIKLLDTNEVQKRNLVCFVYDILYIDEIISTKLNSYQEEMKLLYDLGLNVFTGFNFLKTYQDINEIKEICTKTKIKDISDDLDLDGLVIKINEKKYKEILGNTNHHPKRAIAYKFPAEQISTKINSVDFQVSRSGTITPVANLEPVNIGNVKISRVSLHNFDFIKNKDIHINDYVWIQRSGEVIPYILGVITQKRSLNFNEKKDEIIAPKNCPSCGSKIEKKEVFYYCNNINCKEKIKEKIKYFVDKNCMNIQGLGDSIIDLLINNNIIKNIVDIYSIQDLQTQSNIIKIPGIGEKSILEISREIEKSKLQPIRRLINGLGISGVGKKTSQQIQEKLETLISSDTNNQKNGLEELYKYMTDENFLKSIYGIGEKTIYSIIIFFKEQLEMLKQLEQKGLNFTITYNDSKTNQKEQKVFCITGTFEQSREKIINIFEKNNYKFEQNITHKTTFLLLGNNPGNKKQKAQKLGIKIFESRDEIIDNFGFLNQETNYQDNKNESNPTTQKPLF